MQFTSIILFFLRKGFPELALSFVAKFFNAIYCQHFLCLKKGFPELSSYLVLCVGSDIRWLRETQKRYVVCTIMVIDTA